MENKTLSMFRATIIHSSYYSHFIDKELTLRETSFAQGKTVESLPGPGLLITKPRFFGLYQIASKTGIRWIFVFITHLPLSFREIFSDSNIYSNIKNLCSVTNGINIYWVLIACRHCVGFLKMNALILTLKNPEFSRENKYANKHFQCSKVTAVV